MTPKERRDAQIELRDLAHDILTRLNDWTGFDRTRALDRASMLRAVATELDRVPEEQ